jgi:hypothetical protein
MLTGGAFRLVGLFSLALAASLVAVAADRTFYLGFDVRIVIAALLCIPLPVAFAVSVTRRPTLLEAAIRLDCRAGTKERISSALALEGDAAEMSRAVVEDGRCACEGLDAVELFPFRAPRSWPFTAGLAIALVALFFWMPQLDMFGRLEEKTRREQDKAEIRKQAAKLSEKEQAIQKAAERLKSDELRKSAEEIAKLAEELRKNPEDRKKAIAKMSELSDALKKQEERMAESESANKDLRDAAAKSLEDKTANDGDSGDPSKDKLSSSLADGDLKDAARQLKDSAGKLKDGKMSRKDADKLKKELDKLARRARESGKLKDLGEKFKDASGALESDDYSSLSQKELEELAKALEEMGDQNDALGELREAIGEIDMSKVELAKGDKCPICGGQIGGGKNGKGKKCTCKPGGG